MLAGLAACGLLADCSTTPITVSSTSTALFPPASGGIAVAPEPAPSRSSSALPTNDGSEPCLVHLADVRDARPDPNDLGMMGLRVVRTADSLTWVQTALGPLKQDRRLLFVGDDKSAELVLKIELVKAYVMTMNTQKSANVVLRVGYDHEGKDLDAQIARGRDTGANWANGAGEAQGALDRALTAAVSELDDEIVARCHALESKKPV
jgi:hypothetical protein